jgi:tetratricopeptide (TPR) repeat protein
LKRGKILFEQKVLDSALKDFNEAISLKSDDSKVFEARGLVYLEKNDFDKAIADFKEAIRLEPNSKESVQKLFSNAYLKRCIEFYLKDDKGKNEKLDKTEFKSAKEIAGENIPDKILEKITERGTNQTKKQHSKINVTIQSYVFFYIFKQSKSRSLRS